MAFDAKEFLTTRSVPTAQIDEAVDGGWLPLLVVDQLLFGGKPRYTADELDQRAGADPELARRLWRAMGFTEAPEGEPAYFDEDAAALVSAEGVLGLGLDVAAVVRQTRVMSAAMSRIAETIGDEVVAGLAEARREGVSDDEIAEGLTQWIDPERMEKLLGYFYRRQLRAALWRKLAVPGAPIGDHTETVGFVDLVRFTAITEEIAEDELDALISRFEEVAHDVITGNGSRMVKMIGDEVMFVADDPFEGTKVALELVEAYADDPQLPTARAGVATGGVLARDGDYYGPVVNLASRIVDVARPGHVVTSEALHDALSDHEGLIWRRVPPKRLKGIGLTRLWSVRRG